MFFKKEGTQHLPGCEEVLPYELFASCYDRMMRHVDYPAWAAFVAGQAAFLGVHGGRVIDLACGTGVMLDLLSSHGFTGEGIDISPAMLSCAASRLSARKNFSFSCQDMRDFSTDIPADFLVCLHDSFNYLLSHRDLVAALQRISAALRPGGVAVFDISTRYNIKENFAGRVFSDETDDYAFIWKNSYSRWRAIASVEIEFVVQEGEAGRFGLERHIQKIHSRKAIRKAIAAVPALRLVAEYGGMRVCPVRRHSVGISYILQCGNNG